MYIQVYIIIVIWINFLEISGYSEPFCIGEHPAPVGVDVVDILLTTQRSAEEEEMLVKLVYDLHTNTVTTRKDVNQE